MNSSFNTSWVSNMTDEELIQHSDDELVQGEMVKRFVAIYDENQELTETLEEKEKQFEELQASLDEAEAQIEQYQEVLADIRNLADA